MTHAELQLYLLQRLKMITHVRQRLFNQRRRKRDQSPGVRSARSSHVMTVLMLSDGECCTSARQDSGHDGHDNTHASSQVAGSGRTVASASGRRSDRAL